MSRALPSQPEKRLVFINVGVTPGQHAMLVRQANAHKETIAQVARRLLGQAMRQGKMFEGDGE